MCAQRYNLKASIPTRNRGFINLLFRQKFWEALSVGFEKRTTAI